MYNSFLSISYSLGICLSNTKVNEELIRSIGSAKSANWKARVPVSDCLSEYMKMCDVPEGVLYLEERTNWFHSGTLRNTCRHKEWHFINILKPAFNQNAILITCGAENLKINQRLNEGKSRMKQTKISVITAVYSVEKSKSTARKDQILFLYKYVHTFSSNICIMHYSKDHVGLWVP